MFSWLPRAAAILSMVALYPISASGSRFQNVPTQSADPVRSVVSDRVAEEMLRLARAGAADVVYAMGSSETVSIVAARRFGAWPAATFAEATIVTLDLSPDQNLKLEPLLRRGLRPGTRIVSHRYGIGDWRAEDTARGSDGATLYLWTVPRPPARAPDIFFVPTGQSIVEAMLQLAGVTASDVVYDLGSGDGRIVVLAAQNHGARGVGVEIDPALVEISREVARDAQVDHKVKFIEGDLFEADISEATVVTLFLSPGINRRLEAKLKRELRAGARVVSRQFDMGGWVPDRAIRAEDGTTLYLWTIR